jgi:hypothetical protein
MAHISVRVRRERNSDKISDVPIDSNIAASVRTPDVRCPTANVTEERTPWRVSPTSTEDTRPQAVGGPKPLKSWHGVENNGLRLKECQ